MSTPGQHEQANWNLDYAIELVSRQFETVVDRIEAIASGERKMPERPANRTGPDGEVEQPGPNPLRHWRWE